MKLYRLLQVALLGAVLITSVQAQTEADVAALLPKAQRGNAIAQYRLGVAYSTGQGVTADPIEAYIWLSLAYEGGFRGKALGNVAGAMDTAQLDLARQKLAERRTNLNQKPAPAPSPKPDSSSDADIPVVRAAVAPALSAPAPAAAPAASSSLAQELAAANTDKQQLSGELSKSWNETEELKKQVTELQSTSDFLTAETSKLRSERDNLAAKFDALTNETTLLRNERDQARSGGTQADQALALANSQKASLESSLRAAQASAAADKKSLSDELTKSFQEVSALKSQLAAQTKAIASAPTAPSYPDLSGKVRELEASLTGLATEANASKQEAKRLADDRIEREKQLISLQQQSANLETALAAAKSEASQAGQQIAALTEAKTVVEKTLAQRSAVPVYPDLSGKVRELESALASLSTGAKAAKQEASQLADERIEREKQLLAVQQQAAALTEKNSSLQKEAEILRQAAAIPSAPPYPDLREQVAALEGQLSTAKLELTQARQQAVTANQAKATAEKTLAQLSAVPPYPDLSGKVQDLEKALTASTDEAKAAKQQASQLADERIEREKQLLAVQQEAENLRRAAATPTAPAYPDLREQVASLQNQLAAMQNETAQQISLLTQAKETAEKAVAQAAPVPAYPDFSDKVRELQASLTAQTENAEKSAAALQAQLATTTQPAAPTYPDLSGKVQELEAALAARSADAGLTGKAVEELRQAKTEAEQKLATVEQGRAELAQQFEEFKRSALTNQREHLSQQSKIQMLESEKAALRQQTTADQTRLAELSSQLAASRRQATEVYPTAPAYPDQRARVEQLETELTKTNEQANGMVTLLNRSQQEAKAAAEQSEQMRATIRELEEKYSVAKTATAAPAYPDLREQVASLEAALAAAKSTAPAYPDLRDQVSNLEIQLDAAKALPNHMMPITEFNAMKQELADAQAKLTTTLRGYATLEKERDDLAKRPSTAAPAYPDLRGQVASLEAALTAAKAAPASNSQAEIVRLNEAYAALQRTAAQNERDLAATRAQLQSAQSSNAVLAQQNVPARVAPPETPVARPPTRPTVSPAPVATVTPVVASAPTPVAARRVHVVAGGDSLSKLSQRYYGTPSRWQEIYNANRDLIGPNGVLRAGSELRIP